jgi:hypothetical protein
MKLLCDKEFFLLSLKRSHAVKPPVRIDKLAYSLSDRLGGWD